MTGLKMAENFPSQGKKMTLPIMKLHNQHHANSISRLVGKKLLCQLKSESLNCPTLLSQGCKLSKTNFQSQRKNIFRPRDRKLYNQHPQGLLHNQQETKLSCQQLFFKSLKWIYFAIIILFSKLQHGSSIKTPLKAWQKYFQSSKCIGNTDPNQKEL